MAMAPKVASEVVEVETETITAVQEELVEVVTTREEVTVEVSGALIPDGPAELRQILSRQ